MFEQRHCLRFHNAVNSGRTCIRSTFKLNTLYVFLITNSLYSVDICAELLHRLVSTIILGHFRGAYTAYVVTYKEEMDN